MKRKIRAFLEGAPREELGYTEIKKIKPSHGYTNKNYIVYTDKGKLAMRVIITKLSDPNLVAEREWSVLKFLSKKIDVCPKPLYFKKNAIAGSPVMISEFIEGTPLKHGFKLTDEDVLAIADSVAELHSVVVSNSLRRVLKLPHTHTCSTFEEMLDLLKRFDQNDKLVKRAIELVLKAQKRDTDAKIVPDNALLHSDFKLPNIIKSRDKMKFVDWEAARVDDAAKELAIFLWLSDYNRDLTAKQREIFLERYSQKRRLKYDIKRRVYFYYPVVCLQDADYSFAHCLFGERNKLKAAGHRMHIEWCLNEFERLIDQNYKKLEVRKKSWKQ